MARKTSGIRQVLLTVVKYLFLAAVLVFGAAYIASRWAQVSQAFERMNPALSVLAFVLVLCELLASQVAWRSLWPAFHARLQPLHGARVFFVSQLGKYLPGSVWPIAAQAQMAAEVGVSRMASVVLSLIGLLVSVAVGLGFGIVLVPFINAGLLEQYWWLVLLGAFFVACLLPPVMTFGVRIALKIMRRPETPFTYTGSVAVRTVAAQWATWVFGGLHLWVLTIALGGDPLKTLVPALSAFPIAFCIGILLVPVPAGLGVREAALTLIMSAVVPSSVALTAAIVSRVMFALSDFLMAGVAFGADVVVTRRKRALVPSDTPAK